MTSIYDQHAAAFKSVSAFVVVKMTRKASVPPTIDRVATIAFKHPADGAGRLYCYLHIFGGPMVRGFATGGGYDKKTAAASVAGCKVKTIEYPTDSQFDVVAIRNALMIDGGKRWDDCLRDAGFLVMQAV